MNEERGPLETELHERLRMLGLGSPNLVEAVLADQPTLTVDQSVKLAFWTLRSHMDIILRLAKEIDRLNASKG